MAQLKGWTSPAEKVFGQYGSGSSGDKTNLESKVYLKRGGKAQSSQVVNGSEGGKSVLFPETKRGDEIHWEAKTLCNNKKTSDRITVVLSYYDPIYIGQLSDQVFKSLTDDELNKVMEGDTEIIQSKVENLLDISRAIKQVYSSTVVTDKDGIATGVIPIVETYPYSEYTLTIHYGYSGLAERSDKSKAIEFWAKDIGLIVLELGLIAAAIAVSAGTAILAFGLAATAVGAVDLALMAGDYLSSGFGAIDQNNRGCLFPAMGYNHSYAFIMDEPIPESAGGGTEIATQAVSQINLSPETETKLKEIGDTYSFAQIAIVGSATLAALLLLVFGGRKSAE
tara:strand:+ start:1143 stop:2156 length:1014 start_codon:yes stop_codon:yes gene_type:complete